MSAIAIALLIFMSQTLGAARSMNLSASAEAVRAEDLTSALRAADFAEVYVIPPWISFPAAPTPWTVRTTGCKYVVSRHAWNGDTLEWRELEQTLAGIKAEPATSTRRRQVYYGLVLGDGKGTVREIYADHLSHPPGKVFALDARRQVHFPSRFATALYAFAARHPELAQGPPERCPSRDKPWPPDYIDRDIRSNR